jgi:hypothetical protein
MECKLLENATWLLYIRPEHLAMKYIIPLSYQPYHLI